MARKSKMMLKKIDDLLNTSLGYGSIPGPVHLNIRFDEPLIDNDKLKISPLMTILIQAHPQWLYLSL